MEGGRGEGGWGGGGTGDGGQGEGDEGGGGHGEGGRSGKGEGRAYDFTVIPTVNSESLYAFSVGYDYSRTSVYSTIYQHTATKHAQTRVLLSTC